MSFLKNLSTREKILLALMLFIGLYTIYFLYIFQPLQGEIEYLNEEKVRKERQLFIETAMARKVPELRELYNSVKHVEGEVDFLNLSSENFLELIQEISKSSGAELVTFIPAENVENLTLNITMIGHYEEINHFLSGLKRLASQIEVSHLSLKPNEEELKMDMILTRDKSGSGDENEKI